MMKFQDLNFNCNSNFCICLTVKLTSPRSSPEVSSFVAPVNHCVTEIGLREQLLDILITKRHHGLEEQKIEFVNETSGNKDRLSTLQRTSPTSSRSQQVQSATTMFLCDT
jgi:hypothetical protein